ncbi:hypothetical protein HPB50_027828 [Hyalomma asiaticum]|nr:hypothetical protein HPB50_027828 [Hyalomma asiaticum]
MGISLSRKRGPAQQVKPVREVPPCMMLDDVLELNERPLLYAVEQPTGAMRSGNTGEPRTISRYDMDGNYKEDRFIHGSDQANVHLLSHHGHIVDTFINYSHHVEATHSPGWTPASYWHGVGFQVFTLFLVALEELIHVHRSDLHSWLYVLLPRLFIRTGTDPLSSLRMKIQKILSIIRSRSQFCDMWCLCSKPWTLGTCMSTETRSMVAKLSSWIRDQKNPELKRLVNDVAYGGNTAACPPASQPYQALSNQKLSVQVKKVVHNVYAQARKSDLRW